MPTASSTCSAKDLGTGKEQKITITASSGLSKDEVDRMMREASRTPTKTRSGARTSRSATRPIRLCMRPRNSLKESGDKLGAGEKQAIEGAVEGLKKAIESNDAGRSKSALEALTAAQHKAAEKMYQQAGGPQQPGPDGDPGPQPSNDGDAKSGDVIDAEVVDDK